MDGYTFLWLQHLEDRQEDCYTFEARLGCIAEPCLNNTKQQQLAGMVIMLFVCNYFLAFSSTLRTACNTSLLT